MQLGVSGDPPLCRHPALVKVQGIGLGGLHSLVEDADLGLFGIEAGEVVHGGLAWGTCQAARGGGDFCVTQF